MNSSSSSKVSARHGAAYPVEPRGEVAVDEQPEIARRFFAALVAGDASAALRCLTPEAVLWQNYDRAEKSLADRVGMIAQLVRSVELFTYADARIERTMSGTLVRHLLIAKFDGGREVQVPMIVHLDFQGDRIARAEEYMDSAQMAPLAAFLQAVPTAD